MHDALIGPIVLIDKQNRPIRRESGRINGESVVLCGYEAPACSDVRARLIVTTIAVSECN